MSSDSLLVIDVQQQLHRLIDPDLGLVLVMLYVLGTDRLVWEGLGLSDRTCFISDFSTGWGCDLTGVGCYLV